MYCYKILLKAHFRSAQLIFAGMKKVWDQLLRYLFIRKKDPDAPKTTYVKMMHGMNRVSILLFLICVIILLVRLFTYFFHHLSH